MKNCSKEKTRYSQVDLLGGIELLEANYCGHHFSKHVHDGYAFGVITKGELDFSYLHKKWEARAGDINLVVPGEVHDGHGKDSEGWSYKMLYLPTALLKEINLQRTGKDRLPWFSSGLVSNSKLAAKLLNIHREISSNENSLLQQESDLVNWLTSFIELYSEERPLEQHIGKEKRYIKLCLEYLNENYWRKISITELSELTGLSPYYLLRAFKQNVGIPPHLYLQQKKIAEAKTLITEGIALSTVAADLGYTDQSHFSKQFKQITGITPGDFFSSALEKKICGKVKY